MECCLLRDKVQDQDDWAIYCKKKEVKFTLKCILLNVHRDKPLEKIFLEISSVGVRNISMSSFYPDDPERNFSSV